MQTAPETVEFAGQRILAMDSRAEKMLRSACVACGSGEAQSLGVKNQLELVRCRRCASIYTPYSPWYSSEFFYERYYPEQSLAPPAFVQTRLEEITAGFSRYRQQNRLLVFHKVRRQRASVLEAFSTQQFDPAFTIQQRVVPPPLISKLPPTGQETER